MDLRADAGSVVNISGGSVATISGGTFSSFEALLDSDVTFRGGEFLLNGIPVADLATVTLNDNDVLTGTLEDGSVFLIPRPPTFITFPARDVVDVAFEPVALPAADLTPIVVDDALDVAPTGLRAGQSLTLRGDGALGSDFVGVDATLNVEGGSVDNSEVANSTVTISDGEVSTLTALLGSEISFSGGQLGRLRLLESSAEISGGSLDDLTVGSGSAVDFTGGTLGGANVRDGGTLNVRGGTIAGDVSVSQGGVLNLFVTEAFIDDVPIDDLLLGQPQNFVERDATLSGVLADGSEFSVGPIAFQAALGIVFFDFFDESSTVTVTLVSPVLLGDVNQDEVVNFSDIPSFIEVLQAGIFLPEADLNQDGEVNFEDIPRFVEILQAQ